MQSYQGQTQHDYKNSTFLQPDWRTRAGVLRRNQPLSTKYQHHGDHEIPPIPTQSVGEVNNPEEKARTEQRMWSVYRDTQRCRTPRDNQVSRERQKTREKNKETVPCASQLPSGSAGRERDFATRKRHVPFSNE